MNWLCYAPATKQFGGDVLDVRSCCDRVSSTKVASRLRKLAKTPANRFLFIVLAHTCSCSGFECHPILCFNTVITHTRSFVASVQL